MVRNTSSSLYTPKLQILESYLKLCRKICSGYNTRENEVKSEGHFDPKMVRDRIPTL